MKSIKKGPEPRALRQWKADNANTPDNLRYGGGGFPAEALRQALLLEQQHLCAYTLKALPTLAHCAAAGQDSRHACHIEHILPQARKIPAETIDYGNMVACYPPSQSTIYCDYGAKKKADYDPSECVFVSPLSAQVERHFAFHRNGQVEGLSPEGNASIAVLNLNHPTLVDERRASIEGFLHPKGKKGKPLSAAAARSLATRVMQADGQQCLPAYCVAIAQAVLKYAEREERRAARLKSKPRS